MALITVSGEPGCRHEEVARITAQRLQFDLITHARLNRIIEEELGQSGPIPDKAYLHLLSSIFSGLASAHHLVTTVPGAEAIARDFSGPLRVHVTAPGPWRIGTLMLDRRLERPAAQALLRELDRQTGAERKRTLGRSTIRTQDFDIVLNAVSLDSEQMAAQIETAAASLGLAEKGLLPARAEAKMQFEARLELAKHGISPPGNLNLKRTAFGHPSEEIFANLLDYYRIAWEYEPRSFPIQWSKDGKVLEAFTPDFYLPEFDLYVELTTMKQSLVTRKNRKVKLLRSIYPQVNIQVFYQKDFQNLIFKYGLAERATQV
ncbi:MAG: hypothetical protein ACRD7E_31425 [Bryobacteraceae bacterium]